MTAVARHKAATARARRAFCRALRLVGTPPAAARREVAAALAEGVREAAAVRAGARP